MMTDEADIIELAAEMIGDRERAWFHDTPIPAFERKTARELVAEGHADAVRAHLKRLRDGGFA